MTFWDLKQSDRENAFRQWMTVHEAKVLGDIPEKYWDFFTDTCTCGSENIIRRNLKAITCCNPKCPIKQGFALAELLTRFGVKGLKEATCSKIYKEFLKKDKHLKEQGEKGILISDSYIAALAVNWPDYPAEVAATAKGTEFFNACIQIRNMPVTFPTLVANLAIPSIGSNAEKLVAGFSDFGQLFHAVKLAGTPQQFCISRGFYSETVAFNFRNSLFDIATADAVFRNSLQPEGLMKLNVCMTGMIFHKNVKTTKDAYIKKCNSLCKIDSIQIIEVKMTTAKETNPFILYSRESSDAKYLAGLNRGVIKDEFGEHPVLLHTDTFYKFLEKVVLLWGQQKEKLGSKETLMTFQMILTTAMMETLAAEASDNKEMTVF